MTVRRAIVQIEGSVQELPAGDSLVDDPARRRAELYSIQQREDETLNLVKRSSERVATPILNRSTGTR